MRALSTLAVLLASVASAQPSFATNVVPGQTRSYHLGLNGPFGVKVVSVGSPTVPIVVEGAFYWTIDGVLWAAGSNVVATPIP